MMVAMRWDGLPKTDQDLAKAMKASWPGPKGGVVFEHGDNGEMRKVEREKPPAENWRRSR
jgi:hypothetical protein